MQPNLGPDIWFPNPPPSPPPRLLLENVLQSDLPVLSWPKRPSRIRSYFPLHLTYLSLWFVTPETHCVFFFFFSYSWNTPNWFPFHNVCTCSLSCLEHCSSGSQVAVLLISQASSLHGLFVELNSITLFYFLRTACQCWQFSYLHICLHVSVFLTRAGHLYNLFQALRLVMDDAWHDISNRTLTAIHPYWSLLTLPLAIRFPSFSRPWRMKKRAQRWSPIIPTVSQPPQSTLHRPK